MWDVSYRCPASRAGRRWSPDRVRRKCGFELRPALPRNRPPCAREDQPYPEYARSARPRARLVRPTVGLMAATPLALPGHTMLPSVSLPTRPQQSSLKRPRPSRRSSRTDCDRAHMDCSFDRHDPTNRWSTSKERKFAHSDKIRFAEDDCTAGAEVGGDGGVLCAGLPTSANDPALVCILSPVSMLSLSRMGFHAKGPAPCPACRRLSARLRHLRRVGVEFDHRIDAAGPLWSSARIRAMYSRSGALR